MSPVSRKFFFSLSVLLAAFIAWQSLRPMGESLSMTHIDKLEHFAAYGLLAALLALSIRLKSVTLFILVSLYGALMELLQGAFSDLNRTLSLWDQVFNMAGAAVALAVIFIFMRRFTPHATAV